MSKFTNVLAQHSLLARYDPPVPQPEKNSAAVKVTHAVTQCTSVVALLITCDSYAVFD